jgi:hypothetical protein
MGTPAANIAARASPAGSATTFNGSIGAFTATQLLLLLLLEPQPVVTGTEGDFQLPLVAAAVVLEGP